MPPGFLPRWSPRPFTEAVLKRAATVRPPPVTPAGYGRVSASIVRRGIGHIRQEAPDAFAQAASDVAKS